MPKQKSKLSVKKRKSNINKSASYRKKKTTNKTKRSRKLTKKLSRHKKQKRIRKQTKNTKLIDGGGCGCGVSGSSNTFKSYMSDLKSSLNINDKLKGGGYYKDVLSPGIGNKAEVKWHKD
jgi:hypothetical protein